MSNPCVLAIDAGTGSCRALLFDQRGTMLVASAEEWTHAPEPGVTGSQVFDTEGGWQAICRCIRRAMKRADVTPDDVRAVTATSMREGMVLFDDAGRELWACPNVDSRAGEEAAELVRSGAAERIFRRAGDWVAITAPARFLWLRHRRSDVLERTAAVGMLGDWILFRLSGHHVTDPSLGSSSGMFDLARRTWSPEVIDLLELDHSIFPPVVAPGTHIGEVTATGARDSGLTAGTPVLAGGADTQLGLVGLGLTDTRSLTVIGGSFWQQTALLDEPLIDGQARLRTLCHALPKRWMLEGIGFWSGLTLRWFRDAFFPDLDAGDPYASMEAQAALVPPGANGVLGLFSGVMQADRWTHAAPGFLGFDITDPTASGRKECVRAIQEAAAYVTHAHQQIIESLTDRTFDEVVFTGGGARGVLWPQILADVTGLPVRVPEMLESTALGAAVLAGVGADLYSSAEEILTGVLRFRPPHEPSPAHHSRYVELEQQWTAVYRRSHEMVDDGLLQPMWRAAGAQETRGGRAPEAPVG